MKTNHVFFILWVLIVTYSIINVIWTSTELSFTNQAYTKIELEPGYEFLNRPKDNTDGEWKNVLKFLRTSWPFLVCHVIGSEFLRAFGMIEVLSTFHALISTIYALLYFGPYGYLLLIIQPCIFSFIIIFQSKILVWTCALLTVVMINHLRSIEKIPDYFHVDEAMSNMILVTASWVTLRCISGSLDLIDELKNFKWTIYKTPNLFGYVLYLPALFFGPVQIYSTFIAAYERKSSDKIRMHMRKFALRLLRFIAWAVFTDFALHFVYVTELQYHLELVKPNVWAFYGLGYCMGQFFHLKYVVMYGLSTTFMQLDGIPSLNIPTCIAHVHDYSYMWKYFDNGLYKFIVKYIHVPILRCFFRTEPMGKITSTIVCFAFVFVWHGMQTFVFVWTLMNFIALILENFARPVAICLSERARGLLFTPLVIVSALSNFYFFGGVDVGNAFVGYFFEARVYHQFLVMCCVYTMCRVSMSLRETATGKAVGQVVGIRTTTQNTKKRML